MIDDTTAGEMGARMREASRQMEAMKAEIELLRTALCQIAIGPNTAPMSEPWSQAQARIALSRDS